MTDPTPHEQADESFTGGDEFFAVDEPARVHSPVAMPAKGTSRIILLAVILHVVAFVIIAAALYWKFGPAAP